MSIVEGSGGGKKGEGGPYRLLIDYGVEGWKFWDTAGYGTVQQAVAEALKNSYGNGFKIVTEVDWVVIERGRGRHERD